MSLKTALDALDKATWHNGDANGSWEEKAIALATTKDAAPEALAWIKRAVPLFLDSKCGIDNAFGEGSKIASAIDALLLEVKE